MYGKLHGNFYSEIWIENEMRALKGPNPVRGTGQREQDYKGQDYILNPLFGGLFQVAFFQLR